MTSIAQKTTSHTCLHYRKLGGTPLCQQSLHSEPPGSGKGSHVARVAAPTSREDDRARSAGRRRAFMWPRHRHCPAWTGSRPLDDGTPVHGFSTRLKELSRDVRTLCRARGAGSTVPSSTFELVRTPNPIPTTRLQPAEDDRGGTEPCRSSLIYPHESTNNFARMTRELQIELRTVNRGDPKCVAETGVASRS